MTQVNLPNRNITGDNLWSQVEDNDDAIADVVNGNLDNGNIKSAADINASKLLDGSITADKLGTDSVTTAKINAGAVDTAEIADGAVTSPKLDLTILTDTPAVATSFSGSSGGANVTGFSVELVAGTYLLIAQIQYTQLQTTNGAQAFLYNQTDATQVGSPMTVTSPGAPFSGGFPLLATLTVAATKTVGVRMGPSSANETNITVSGESNLIAIRLA